MTDGPDSNEPKAPAAAKAKPGKPAPISQILYDAMWTAYAAGTRSALALSRQLQVSRDTATKAIKRGWPEKGWPALLDRSKLHDAQMAAAKQQVHVEAARLETDAWENAKERILTLADLNLATVSAMSQGVYEAAKACRYTKIVTRRSIQKLDVKGEDGKIVQRDVPVMVTEEVPMDATEVSEAMRRIAAAFETIAKLKAYWLGGPTERVQAIGSITPDQARQIIETGVLPTGVTDAMLARALGAP